MLKRLRDQMGEHLREICSPTRRRICPPTRATTRRWAPARCAARSSASSRIRSPTSCSAARSRPGRRSRRQEARFRGRGRDHHHPGRSARGDGEGHRSARRAQERGRRRRLRRARGRIVKRRSRYFASLPAERADSLPPAPLRSVRRRRPAGRERPFLRLVAARWGAVDRHARGRIVVFAIVGLAAGLNAV